jgi:hypothetical protein
MATTTSRRALPLSAVALGALAVWVNLPSSQTRAYVTRRRDVARHGAHRSSRHAVSALAAW